MTPPLAKFFMTPLQLQKACSPMDRTLLKIAVSMTQYRPKQQKVDYLSFYTAEQNSAHFWNPLFVAISDYKSVYPQW